MARTRSSRKRPPVPDPRSTTARQRAILDHALDLTREGGLAGLTMKRIAERVGFTEPALYRHFPNKQDLLLGLVARMESLLLGGIDHILASEAPPEAQLERVLEHHVTLVLRTDGLPFLLLAEAAAGGNRELGARMVAVMRKYVRRLAALVAQTAGGEDRPPPEEVAFALLGLPAMLAIRHRLDPDAEREQALAAHLVPFLVRAMTRSASDSVTPPGSAAGRFDPRASGRTSPAASRASAKKTPRPEKRRRGRSSPSRTAGPKEKRK